MAATVIARDAQGTNRRRLASVFATLGLGMAAMLAYAGQIAATPLAAKAPALGWIGPGKLGLLKGQTLDSEGKAPKGIAAIARRALPGAPLAYEPFYGVAAAAFRDKQSIGSPRDAGLLREALRRNPRSREARVLLLRHAVGTGKLASAIDQLAVFNRLNAGAVEELLIGLGAAITNERQVDETVAALKVHPELYLPFVRGFVRANKPPQLAVRLIKGLPPEALANPEMRKLAINQMVAARAFGDARALWGGKTQGLIHSPDFADAKSSPPFNWSLVEDESGVAERDPTGGVFVEYYGRSPGPLLSQLLTLAPGDYLVRLDYQTLGGSPGAIELRLTCMGSETAFAKAPLDGRANAERALELSFTVPAEACQGQMLAVAGRVQERRDSQQVTVRRADIRRGGGQ